MNQEQKEKAQRMFDSFQQKEVSQSDLNKAEKKASNLGSKVEDFKLLLSMFKDGVSGKYSISPKHYAIIGGAILYVVSPIDAIPDIIPVVGWLDDIGIVGMAISSLGTALTAYKATRIR